MIRRAVAVAVLGAVLGAVLASCGSSGSSRSAARPSNRAGLVLTSPAFTDRGTIPRSYTCDGGGKSPPLAWSLPPARTEELALLVFDPDAPGDGFVHFLQYGIAPTTLRKGQGLYAGGVPGMNGRGNEGWVPPCPPRGYPPHRYEFTLFALARHPELAPTANVRQFLDAIRGKVLATGKLTGRYGR